MGSLPGMCLSSGGGGGWHKALVVGSVSLWRGGGGITRSTHPDFAKTQEPKIVPPPGGGGCWTATHPSTQPLKQHTVHEQEGMPEGEGKRGIHRFYFYIPPCSLGPLGCLGVLSSSPYGSVFAQRAQSTGTVHAQRQLLRCLSQEHP